jgi:hypothetical protein
LRIALIEERIFMAADGNWTIILSTPMGEKTGTVSFQTEDAVLTGTMTNEFGDTSVDDGEVDGGHLFWKTKMTQPMPMTLEFDVDVDGDALSGTVKFGPLGEAPVRGSRA